MVPRIELGFQRGRQQAQDQVHAGSFLGDIVLKVSIDSLVAKVQFRQQADQQTIEIIGVQPEQAGQRMEAQFDSAPEAFALAFGNLGSQPAQILGQPLSSRAVSIERPARRATGTGQEAIQLLFRNVQTLELFVRGVQAPGSSYLKANQKVDPLDLGEQMFL